VVPGITSAIGVPGLAGIPLTHRGVAHDAVIVTGHLAPGDPNSLVDWSALARTRGTVVLLMAVDHLPEIARTLVDGGRDGRTPVAVIRNGSLPTEQVLVTTLAALPSDVAHGKVAAPSIAVVGEVVNHRATAATPREMTEPGSSSPQSTRGRGPVTPTPR
jgi:uroporphyrin-III C-methyltransferase/precorrin-2 dehydrogenase/sirohydrochlorin ferrochelatase